MTENDLLRAEALEAGYGRLAVVHDFDLVVAPGTVTAILGANGAGKTTVILTLAGVLEPLGGTIYWKGEAVRSPLHRRVRAGLAFVPEQRSVFMNLTVAQNLRLGQGPAARALEIFPELEPHLGRKAGLLSGGQQQLLTLARCLASEPALLMIDEVSLGLAPLVVKRLLAAIREATARGTAVVLVEQHIKQALAIADYAVVLRRGRRVLEGPAAHVRHSEREIQAAYMPAGE
ncbi:MAG TPA: ATP-binding cassette domain-containing protein [Gaiellaceae bacterium]|nr:ATP-binding cassette domain-containing protein [Gaiellaceae bacterium]